MGRRYWVDLPPTTVSDAIDLLELVPGASTPIKIVRTQIGQTSDFGDAQAENLVLVWIRGHSVIGSGGTSVTPTPNDSGVRTAATFTAKVFNTVIASGGTPINGPRECFNIAFGVNRDYPDGFEAKNADGTLVLRIIDANSGTAPLDPLTVHGSILVEELGF